MSLLSRAGRRLEARQGWGSSRFIYHTAVSKPLYSASFLFFPIWLCPG